MAELNALLGGYGSGSEESGDGDLIGNVGGVVRLFNGVDSPDGSGDQQAGPSSASKSELPASAAPHVINGLAANPEPPPEGMSPPLPHHAVNGSDDDGTRGGMAADDPQLLLPPELRAPPPGEPHPLMQDAAERYTRIQAETGRTIMDELRKNRKWCNPDFLEKMVSYYDLDQYGSAFEPQVWEPRALPQEDTWPELKAALEAQRRTQAEEAAARKSVAFQSSGLHKPGGAQHTGLAPGMQLPPPVPGAAAKAPTSVPAAALARVQAMVSTMPSRKASKWDK